MFPLLRYRFVVRLISLLFLMVCLPAPPVQHIVAAVDHVVGIPNPAAVYCQEMGYTYGTVGNTGYCNFPDGTQCEEWQFFAGQCGAQYSYCAQNGYGLEVRDDGGAYASSYAVCLSPDGAVLGTVSELSNLVEHMSLSGCDTSQIIPAAPDSSDAVVIVPEQPFVGTLPTSFDWRSYESSNWLTPVKNQASCGSCWAFGAVGVSEAAYDIATGNPNLNLDLSEQFLISDCVNAGSCCGGNYSTALTWIQNTGIPDELCFPEADDGCSCPKVGCQCTYTASGCSNAQCSDRCADWATRVVQIDSHANVASNRTTIKEYLLQHGPLVVAIGVGAKQKDGSGYGGYFDSDDIYRCTNDSGANHIVVLVGYDDTDQYWILKNSWGNTWGPNTDGYFHMGYGECYVENAVQYVNVTPAPPTLLLPNSIQRDIVTFTWDRTTPLPTTYTLRLNQSTNPDASWLINVTRPNDVHSYSYAFSTSGTYYWHMRSTTATGMSSWVTRAFTVDLTPPSNDDFDSAVSIMQVPFSNEKYTNQATMDADDPTPVCQNSHNNTVWYKYQPDHDTTVRFNTNGSDYDTVVSVWTGSRTSLSQVGCDDDSGVGLASQLMVSTTAGQTYYIMVSGVNNERGHLIFNAELAAQSYTLANGDTAGLFNAVQSANAQGKPTTIHLAPNGLYTMSQALVLQAGSDVTLEGHGADISGNGNDRILTVNSGATLVMNETGIKNGSITGASGGGVSNSGTATIMNSTIEGNWANVAGGGLYNDGTMVVMNSTLYGNSTGLVGFSVGSGGAVFNAGSMTMDNTTVTQNTAAQAQYSGVVSGSGGTLTIRNSVIAYNDGSHNCSMAGTGVIVDGGNNIDNGTSCLFGGTLGVNTDPKLDPNGLQENGGPTLTVALLPDSPAINAIAAASCYMSRDQRGALRPIGSNCDTGAVEHVVHTCPGGVGDIVALQSAFNMANTDGRDNTIVLPEGPCIYTLYQTLIVLADSNHALTVYGQGSILSGNNTMQVLLVDYDADLTLDDITITEGTSYTGGGIQNHGRLDIQRSTVTGNTGVQGGGIYNFDGDLYISDSTISNNAASTEGGTGGGIRNGYDTTLMIINTTFTGNIASYGGGLYTNGPAYIRNSTFSDNTAYRYSGGGGGAIACPRSCYVTGSTIVNNHADSGSGGAFSLGEEGYLSLEDTIVAENTASQHPDISGGFTAVDSKDYNLITTTTGYLITGTTTHNIYGISPELGPLSDNGGYTLTHQPLAGSPVIDLIPSPCSTGTDQRGVARPQGTTCDIGAVENTQPVTVGCSGSVGDVAGLSSAVADANSKSGQSIIHLTSDCTYPLSSSLVLAEGTDLILHGHGATLNGTESVRIFEVNLGASLTLDNTRLINGHTTEHGGGIFNDGVVNISDCEFSGNDADLYGGGLVNYGSAFVTNSTFTNNAATGGSGIANNGSLTLMNSTVANNTANTGQGGGVYNEAGSVYIENSTIYNNAVTGLTIDGTPGGGGIANNGGTMTIAHSTVAANTANPASRSGIWLHAGSITVRHSIVAANGTGQNCEITEGSLVDGGYNLEDADTCAFSGGTGVYIDPLLDINGLQNNGGPTQTVNLHPDSPAIDAIPAATCSHIVDQRYMARPWNTNCDIGAVEYNNDEVSNAVMIAPAGGIYTQNTELATSAPDDPTPTCGLLVAKTVWYQYHAYQDSTLVVETGGNFDTVVSAWSGTRGNLTELACNDDESETLLSSRLTFDVAADQTYYILVGGYEGVSGDLMLTAATNAKPVVTNPGDQTSKEGDVVSLAIAASDSDNDSLIFSATGLPPELNIDASSGIISGTIAANAASGSPYAVEVTVTDGVHIVVISFSWVVDTTTPTEEPTEEPTQEPTAEPTGEPTEEPTQTPIPSNQIQWIAPLGEIVTIGNPLYQWTDVPGVPAYEVYVGSNDPGEDNLELYPPTFWGIIPASACNNGICSVDLTMQAAKEGNGWVMNGSYSAFISLEPGSLDSASWQGPYSFTVNTPRPHVPTLTSVGSTINWILEGNAGYAAFFYLYLAPVDDVLNPLVNSYYTRLDTCGSWDGVNCGLAVPGQLLNDTIYVLYINGVGAGGFSTGGNIPGLDGWVECKFDTTVSTCIPYPTEPTDLNAAVTGENVTLTWTAGEHTTQYQVWAGIINPLNQIYFDTVSATNLGCDAGGTCTLTIPNVTQSGTYNWFVQAGNRANVPQNTLFGWTVGPEFVIPAD